MLTFDGKEPSKTQHDMNNVRNKDHDLFTNQYFAVADTIRSKCLNEQLSLHALSKLELSKLKSSKHHWYFKYVLILSGDINLHPGPVQYPCSVCAKPVRKRFISCEKYGLWIHKKNVINSKNSAPDPYSYDHLENSWHQFPFADDFFENIGVPSGEQTNIDYGTPTSIDN